MCLLLLLFGGLQARFMSGQSPSDGTGLLWAEIKRKILLALVENAELVALLGVDDSENLSDGLAYVMDLSEFRSSTTGHLLYSQLLELGLELFELLGELGLVLRP